MKTENKHKIAYYYAAGAFVLLLALKLLSSSIFKDIVDFSITYLPFIIIIAIAIAGYRKYKKNPDDIQSKERIRKNSLLEIFYLLLITLVFYILYSPGSFVPIMESLEKMGRVLSMDVFFLIISWISVLVVAFSLVIVFVRLYQKSKGTYAGSIQRLYKNTLYSTFFILAFLFISSFITYPDAYSPITGSLGKVLGSIFFPANDDRTFMERVTNARVNSLKSAFSQTYKNLTDNIGNTGDKLSTTITDTKTSLNNAIKRTNKDLKVNLSGDISDKFDISGGTMEGSLTVQDELTVESTSYTEDIIPTTDDSYDLGSTSKGWDNLYVHAIHGSSIITIGDAATSHGLSSTDDLLVSGDLEVNGNVYFDGALNMGANKIVSVADPTDAQDVVTKAYYEANTPAGVFSRTAPTIYPTNSGDDLDMLANPIFNIGNNGTDFDSSGALTLAGGLTLTSPAVITASSASAHTIGSITITGTDITGLPATPAGNTSAASKLYVDTQVSGAGYQNGSGVTLNMANGVIENIGAAGTDFGSGGGLTLAGNLVLGSNTITTSNTTVITNLNADTTDGYSLNQNVLTASSPSFTALTLTGGNLALGSNTLTTSNSTVVNNLNADQLDGQGGSYYRSADNINAGTLAVARGGTGTSDGSITGTSALTMTPASGSNFNVSLATTGDFAVNTSQLYVDTSAGFVGIGDTTPDSLLDLLSSGAADTYLTIGNTNAGDYDSAIKFELTEGTPSFTVGVDDSDSDLFKISTTALGTSDRLTIDSTGLVSIGQLAAGAQVFENDAGTVSWINLPVVSASASTVESYSAQLDGSAVLTVYGTADGSGGITANTPSVGILTATPTATLHVVNNEGAGATNQGLLLHMDNTAFAGISSTASNNGGGLVITADAVSGTGFDFLAAISSAGGTDDAEFRVRGDGEVYGDGAVYNSGADYAEFFYTKDSNLEAGELVCIDVTDKKAVKRCTRANDLNLIGIISTKPAFVGNNIPGAEANLGEINQNYKLVGLIGQVPAKVTNENGEIKSGDSLTSASIPGYAMKANAGDSTVGVALENFGKTEGVITVLISRRNKSLTVEQVEEETTKRIAEMNIEDEINALVAGAKEQLVKDSEVMFTDYNSQFENINSQLTTNNQQLADINSQFTNLESLLATLQDQIAELQTKTNQELNLAQIDANTTDIAFLKTLLGTERVANPGDLDILGKVAMETTETGGITIRITDKDAPTIGEAAILAFTDENGDGTDDNGSDNKSVEVKTEAATENSKIFITSKTAAKEPLAVTKIKDGESFKVETASPVEEDLEFDWWIIQTD